MGLNVSEGEYTNLTDDTVAMVNKGKVQLQNKSVIFEFQ